MRGPGLIIPGTTIAVDCFNMSAAAGAGVPLTYLLTHMHAGEARTGPVLSAPHLR